jgi:hypothetical protein
MLCITIGTNFWYGFTAIATLAMVVATFLTLRQNRKQVAELKRQWEEEHKARITFDIEAEDFEFFLKIENVGKSVANITKIEINSEFLDKMSTTETGWKRKPLEYLFAHPLRISPGVSKYYLLCSTKETENESELKSTPIKIICTYNGEEHKEEFSIDDYKYILGSWKIEGSIEKALKNIKTELKNITKKLK